MKDLVIPNKSGGIIKLSSSWSLLILKLINYKLISVTGDDLYDQKIFLQSKKLFLFTINEWW